MPSKLVKNILLITHFLPPKHNAGTEQYTLGLGKTLQSRGYNVHILCAEDWQEGRRYWNGVTEDQIDGTSIHRIHLNWPKAANPNRVLYDSLKVEKWLDEFLKNNTFDIVHVTSAYSLGVGILRSVKRANIPLVLTLTDFWFLCPSLQLLRSDGTLCDGHTTAWQCESCLMAGSKLFRTVSKVDLPESITSRVWDTLSHITPISRQRGMRGMLLDMDHRKKIMMEAMALPDLVISPSKIVQTMFMQHISRPVNFLPHGHELSWLNEYHGKTQSDVIRFGYLGGLHEVKGVHLLIEAFKTANLGERARLDIWGTPATNKAYSQKLLSLIGDHPYINLHGAYTRDRLGPILSEIDVAVVPSIWYENAPLVIQEAFATGTPVIATNLGGMAESVVHGINGLLFERNDVVDLVRQLRRVIEEPGLLQKLSSGAPKVKSFDEELVELERIYDQLARENAGAVR